MPTNAVVYVNNISELSATGISCWTAIKIATNIEITVLEAYCCCSIDSGFHVCIAEG